MAYQGKLFPAISHIKSFKGMLRKGTSLASMWASWLPTPMNHQKDNVRVLATDYKNWSITYWCEDDRVIGSLRNTIDRIHISGRVPSVEKMPKEA